MRISPRSIRPLLVVALAAITTTAFTSRRLDSEERLVYVWSDRMPLSVRGLPEAEAAAKALGVRFEAVELEAAHARARPGGALPADVAGAVRHVPSTALVTVTEGVERIRTVLGYKTRDALLSALSGAVQVTDPEGGGGGTRRGHADARAPAPPDVRWVGEPEPGYPGFFYRMIPGTSQFILDRRGSTWVHDTESGARWRGPADLDLVPSPDASFLVAPLNRGLAFYSWAELKQVGPSGNGADLTPFHLDPEMDDQYPSVGVLGEVAGGTHVRVLVSWFDGVRIRDYTLSRTGDGSLAASPRGDVVQPCPGVRLSTPILSPDGRRVSGRDESSASTKVFEIGASGTGCLEVADVGSQTSKATFSPSSRFLTYSRWDASGGRRMAQVYVLDIASGTDRPVSGATSTRLLIPDFGTEEEILILGVRDEMRFEIHCWRGACPA
jgi:hypothetical protein